MDKTSLGDRMKAYERLSEVTLCPRLPVIIRLDGKGFSRLTKKLDKPFDSKFMQVMQLTTEYLCKNISGCMLGYTQSDEISLVLRNDQSLLSQPYFSNRVQKLTSISASMATAAFNAAYHSDPENLSIWGIFDSRTYVVPSITEACNYLIWRQQDCTRNSILGATYYEIAKMPGYGKKTAQKMMHGLKCDALQELLFQTTGINWNNYLGYEKRGTVFRKDLVDISRSISTYNPETCPTVYRERWLAYPPPIFTSKEGWEWMLKVLNPPLDPVEET